MIKDIIPVTDPKLRVKSKTVKKLDKRVKRIIRNLKDTLKVQDDPEGIGLAAPQIGENIRAFVMKPNEEMTVIINPEVISLKKGKKKKRKKPDKRPKTMEGCLSLPHYYGPLNRAESATVKYLGEDGQKKTRTFKGLEAQIIMHEIDHLNGVLFVDRLLEQKQPLYELVNGEWELVDLLI
jgi:peptide deformylase